MRREWLRVIEEKNSPNMCYTEVICTLVCEKSSFVSWLYHSDIWKYVEVLAYHSLGLWHKVDPSDFDTDSWVISKELMFNFGSPIPKHSILTFFLDWQCHQVRICGVQEVVSLFVKAFNEEVASDSFIKAFEKAVLRQQE